MNKVMNHATDEERSKAQRHEQAGWRKEEEKEDDYQTRK
jgi:hypothetical protein